MLSCTATNGDYHDRYTKGRGRCYAEGDTRDQKKENGALTNAAPVISYDREAELSRPLALRHHRCLAHLPQHAVQFASLNRLDNCLDCRDEPVFLAD